ncbi:MAG: hypothetical protein IID39_02665 [Planctomycetes bacterium]|nr:hypothetical protein [Planctomycetota bacterium]
MLMRARRYDEAIKLLKTWLREVETSSIRSEAARSDGLKRQLAVTLVEAQRNDEAITALTQWIDEADGAPVKFSYLSILSGCYQRRGQTQRVLEVLEQTYRLKGDLEVLEQAYRLKGDRRAAGLTRDLIGIRNDFGYSLADAGLRMEEAERMIRYALSHAPLNGAYLDSYGWVLYKQGAFAEAKEWLEKAVNTPGGDDPVVYDHLGDAHWRLGLEDAAERFWSTALERIAEQLEEEDRLDYIQIRANLQEKIKACESGESPQVAPLATEADERMQVESEERDSP